MIRVIFYRNKCIGCGACSEIQPMCWRMSKKDGKAVLLNSVEKNKIFQLLVHSLFKDELSVVEKACPARAIKVI